MKSSQRLLKRRSTTPQSIMTMFFNLLLLCVRKIKNHTHNRTQKLISKTELSELLFKLKISKNFFIHHHQCQHDSKIDMKKSKFL